MPSETYRLFRSAILARKQIVCIYRGKRRELCPHILGYKDGKEVALTYQFAGESNSTLPPDGEWRCLSLVQVSSARIRDGEWLTGDRHSAGQVCVAIVDLDVNR